MLRRLYLAVESVQMGLLRLEEALQVQGLRSKAPTAKCSSRFYLSTTTVSSSKVSTLIRMSWLACARAVARVAWLGLCKVLVACVCGCHV